MRVASVGVSQWRLLVGAVCLALSSWAGAQELVSVKSAGVNLRAAPGTDAEVLWQLAKGYPLQVLERQGPWLKVQDFEGDQGWLSASVADTTPHHVVRVVSANLRAGPGTQYPVVGTARYGQVLTTSLRQEQWVRIQRPKGQTAWVARELLWGW